MGFGMINIAELLGDPKQDTTLQIKAKGLPKPEVATEQTQSQPVQNIKEDKTGLSGVIQDAGNFLSSPAGKSILVDFAQGVTRGRGVGGAIATSARSTLEAQQFGALVSKLERGEEITGSDLIGISPEGQQRAGAIIQSKKASERADELLGLKKDAAPGDIALTAARTEAITGSPEQRQNEIVLRTEAEQQLERLKAELKVPSQVRITEFTFSDRKFYGYVDPQTGKFVELATGDPTARDLGTTGGAGVKPGRRISPADLDVGARGIQALETFKVIQDKRNTTIGDALGFGLFDPKFGGDPDENARKLGTRGITPEEFKQLTGKDPTSEQLKDIEQINRFKDQFEKFNQQLEHQPQLNGNETSQIPPDVLAQIDNYLSTTVNPNTGKTIPITDKNRLIRFKQIGGRF